MRDLSNVIKKLLVVCGPTSTGKTSLALILAKKFKGEIVSADSRQVYREMDIGTGKDLPANSKLKFLNSILGFRISSFGFYLIQGIRVWGYDLADPRRDFSVAQYLKVAHKMIDEIAKRGKLPILVGGTGLYIKGVVDGIPTAEVPKNNLLRKNLEKMTTSDLYDSLASLDPVKAASLNTSDRKNPRRLVRAIEIAQYHLSKKNLPVHHAIGNQFDIYFVGLTASKDFLESKIKKRIFDRINLGLKDEIRKLLRRGVKWEDQSMVAMGYGQWRDYFEGGVNEENVISEWERAEKNYTKRQMTWFKKDKRVNWFDITAKNYPKDVEKAVQKWYHQADNV